MLEDPLVPLDDLITVSKLISGKGASIETLNTVRRSLSRVKAGGFANYVLQKTSARMIGLIISDVMDDRLEMVASGPTVVSPTSHRHRQLAASNVLQNFKREDVPDSIFQCLQNSDPVVRPVKSDPSRISNYLLANNAMAVEGAVKRAVKLGFTVVESVLDVNQDVETLARDWAALAKHLMDKGLSAPTAIVVGGEPTVNLCEAPQRGGRNLQLAALLLREMVDGELGLSADVAFLSGGSDGEDGTAPVAGAGFDAETLRTVSGDKSLRSALDRAVEQNNCYAFFEKVGLRVLPPAISTNVCDLQVLLIGERTPE